MYLLASANALLIIVNAGFFCICIICIGAYVDSIAMIRWYHQRKAPLAVAPPKPTWRQRVINLILTITPIKY